MVRLTSCNVHRTAILPIQALKRSQISILVVSFLTVEALRPLPYTGKIQSCFESQFLHDSRWIFHSTGYVRKNQPHTPFPIFTLSSASALTMLHSFHLRMTIGFGGPLHYYPCLSCETFRFSGYDFTTLLHPVRLQPDSAQWSISPRTACGLTNRSRIVPFRH